MASHMIIHKTAEYGGGETSAMSQATAKTYLEKLVSGTRVTNLGQALNQAFDDGGKSCGSLTYNGHSTLHASAGKTGVSSVTLFYYEQGGILYLFAMGEHESSSSYNICDFGPSTGSFKYKGTVSL